jgi:hypothetical protein
MLKTVAAEEKLRYRFCQGLQMPRIKEVLRTPLILRATHVIWNGDLEHLKLRNRYFMQNAAVLKKRRKHSELNWRN